jgi:acetolactate synthase regulatory subunit
LNIPFITPTDTMPISQKQKEISVKFVNALTKILDIIDEISPHIPEGKYVEIMKQLKISHNSNGELMDTIRNAVCEINNTEQVRTARRQAEMTVIIPKPLTTKFKHICPLCDTRVLNVKEHQASNKCSAIQDTKRLSAKSGKQQTNRISFMEDKIFNIEYFQDHYYYKQLIKNWKNNMN